MNKLKFKKVLLFSVLLIFMISIFSVSCFAADGDQVEQPSSYYSLIYDLLITNIYGDIPITPDMTLSVSLISTILSMLVVLAPVLVGGFIFVWCLKRF